MPKLRAAAAVLIFSMLLIYVAVFFQLRGQLLQGYSDFISFYTAGKILQRGAAHRLYDLHLQYDIQHEVAPDVSIRQAALPFVRPPFEAWLFLPLAYLPYSVAFIVWNLVNCGCLLTVTLLLRTEIPELQRFSSLAIWLAVVSYFPVFVTFLQGQDSILLLVIYVVAYKLLSRNAYFAGGIVLGLGIIKFTLLLPFLVLFAVRKRFDLVAGFALTCLALLGISLATVGASTVSYYPQFLLSIDSVAKGVNVPKDMPNLRGLLTVITRSTLSSAVSLTLLAAVSLLLLIYAIRNWNPNLPSLPDGRTRFGLGFSLSLVTTILVSYHCHSFDLSLLILPIASVLGLLLSRQAVTPGDKFLVWSLVAVVFSPIYIVFSFFVKYPALISLLLLLFASAIGFANSELKRTAAADMSVVGLSGS